MKDNVDKHERKAHISLDPEKLCWTPYVMGKPTSFFAMGEEANQPMQTVAARDEPVEIHEQSEGGVHEAIRANDDTHSDATETTELEPQTNGAPPKTTHKKSPPTLALTPQPSILEQRSGSPRRQSPRKTPNPPDFPTRSPSRARHPEDSSGPHLTASPGLIPAIRFEIFPAVPGMAAAKRRAGRPARGSSRRSTYGTPARRSTLNRRNSPSERGSATLRRTRSKLGGLALSAADVEDGASA
ncbi:Histone acetyltransferase [Friedmanniomyces endolithicus]|nr:Histone acetyltransferase [Friedmanniomyces endolithicus]